MASVSDSSDLKVISWNINGLKAKLNSKKRKEELLRIIEENDIVLLQETRIGEEDKNKEAKSDAAKEEQKKEEGETNIEKLIREVEGRFDVEELVDPQNKVQNPMNKEKTMYVTYFSSRRRGVAILINKPHQRLRASCKDGDYAWVHVEIDCEKYTLMSVYYHSKETADLMDSMSELLRRETAFQNKLVIGGDFNTSLDSDLDAKTENKSHKAQRERLVKFMEDRKLSDVWRENHPEKPQYTYSTRDPKSRLDYILMLTKDLRYVQSCDINEGIDLSDHFPVTLTLRKHVVDDEDVTSRLSELEL